MGTVLSTFSSNDANDCGPTIVDRYPNLPHHPHQPHNQHIHPTIQTNYANTIRKSAFENQTLNCDRSNQAYLYEDFDSIIDRVQSPIGDQCRGYNGDQTVSDTTKLTNSMNMLSLKRFIFPNLSRKPKSGGGFSRQSCKARNSMIMSRSDYRTQRICSDGFENVESRDSEMPVYYYPIGTNNQVTANKWSQDLQRNYTTTTSACYNRVDGLPNSNQLNLVRTSEYEYDKSTPSGDPQLGFNQRHVRFNPRRQLSEPNGHFRPQLASCGSGENLVNQHTQSRVLYTYTPSLIDLRRVNRCADSQSLNPHMRSINRNHSLRLPRSPYVSSRSSADVQLNSQGSNWLLAEPDSHPEGFHSQADSHLCTYDTSPAARSCNYNFDSRFYDSFVPFESECQDQGYQAMGRSHNRMCLTPQLSYHLSREPNTDRQSLVQVSPMHLKHGQAEQMKSDLPAQVQNPKSHNEFSKSLTKSISCYALKFFNYHSAQTRLKKSIESETLFKIPRKRESSFVERSRKSQSDKRRTSHILTRKDKPIMSTSIMTAIPTATRNVLVTNPATNMNTSTSTNANHDTTDNINMSNSNFNHRITSKDSMYGDLQQQQRFDWNRSIVGKPWTYNSSSNYVQFKENGLYNHQLGTNNTTLMEDNRSDIIDLKPKNTCSFSNEVISSRNGLNRSQWNPDFNNPKSGSICCRHSDFLLRQPIYKASTGELLRCLSFFIVTRIQLRLTQSQHRINTNLRNLQPSIIVAWIRAIDRALLLQGWSEVAFINPIHVVFLFMMLRDFVDSDITTEQELHTIIMACLYLAYSYMGNEISYPLKPFLVAETNQLIAHTNSEKKVLSTEQALMHGHENSIKSKVIDEVRNRFWQYVLRILNAKSSEMLRINADPLLFTELFGELKSYENAFTMPVKIPMRSTNRPL